MKQHKDHLLIHSHYTFLSDGGISFAIAICQLTMTPGFYWIWLKWIKIPKFDCNLLL